MTLSPFLPYHCSQGLMLLTLYRLALQGPLASDNIAYYADQTGMVFFFSFPLLRSEMLKWEGVMI